MNECGYYIELKNYKTQKDMEKEENIDGFLNRHEVKLPIDKCLIEIIVNENPPQTEKCEWLPAEKNNPSKDFIGTAVRIRNPKIGYNAWRQNDTEFVFYRIID